MTTATQHLISTIFQTQGYDTHNRKVLKSGQVIDTYTKKYVTATGRQGTATEKVYGITKKQTKEIYRYSRKLESQAHATARMAKEQAKLNAQQTRGKHKTNDLVKALKRAAIVAPVWLALRSAMMGVLRTISLGAKYWVELASNLARAQAVTTDTTVGMGKSMDMLKKKAESFAIAHKGTAKDVIESYYRMATSGMNFNDAMAAAVPATKLAIGTYGDIATTAKTVSAIFRLMGDTIEGATTRQERMAKIVDVLGKAWSDHEFDMNQMSQAIGKSATQAKAFGMSMTELIAVLSVSHDALIKGGSSGRLFGRALDELAKNLDKVGVLIGRTFDPTEAINWFDVFMELIDKFKEMPKHSKMVEENFASIFNIRSRREVRALMTLHESLVTTLDTLENKSEGFADALLKIRDATPEAQLENLRENMSKLIADFFTGVTSSGDFAEALEKINKNLSEMSLNVTVAGAGISAFAINVKALFDLVKTERPKSKLGFFGELFGRAGLGSAFETLKIFKKIKGIASGIGEFKGKDITGEMEEAATKWMERQEELLSKRTNKRKEEVKKLTEQLVIEKDIHADIVMKLALADKLITYKEMELKGYNKIQIANQKIVDYVDAVVDRLKVQNSEVDKQQLLSAILSKNWKEVLKLTKETVITEKELVNIEKMVNQVSLERLTLQQNLTKSLISHELSLFKIKGATAKTIAESTYDLENQFGINQDIVNMLKKELNIEKEITKEKLRKNRLSSDAIKLYEISLKYGNRTAEKLQDVIEGRTDINSLGKKYLGILEKEMGTLATRLRAEKYWEGKRLPGEMEKWESNKAGLDIEYKLSKLIPPVVKKEELKKEPIVIQPNIEIPTEVITNVYIDGEKITDESLVKVETEIKTEGTSINKEIKKISKTTFNTE